MDKKKIKKAIRDILEAIGENPDREDLKDTPSRVAEMCEEIFSGISQQPQKELEVLLSKEHDEIVLVKDIPLYSVCEHHLLPFIGKAHVAYIPDGSRVTGLSKLARVVEVFSKRLQVQEKLTTEIADTLMKKLKPRGVLVIIEAEHLCYDDETEILTENGWKFFKDIDRSDKVSQVDASTRVLSFIKPHKVISYKYSGKMVKIRSLSVDLLVTLDHRFYYCSEWNFYHKENKNWQISPVSTLTDKYIIIPRACNWIGKDLHSVTIGKYEIDFDVFIKLFGIWVSEGCVTRANKRKFFVVSQSPKSKHFSEIESLFKKLKVKYIKTKNGRTVQFRIEDGDFYQYFKKFGKSGDKYIPRFIKSASRKNLKLFLDWYAKGDGHITKRNGFHFVSKSERLIDDLQEICIKLGIGCTKQNNKNYFRMETHRTKTKPAGDKWYSKLMPHHFLFRNYKGKVYCVSVPKGLVLVRRNGKVAISGNCMSMRGVKKPGTLTITSAVRGIFKKNQKTRSEALALIKS
ncbi:MAG: GTP cyclohydrolase I FolE [Thermoplasmatales archaeon]|nr:MAG: GTP cyclohydrolase I FolE [Thermoplasmatales archaeon]